MNQVTGLSTDIILKQLKVKGLSWETREPKESYQDFIRSERRYTALLKTAPEEAEALFAEAEKDAKKRMEFYKNLGGLM